MNYEQIKKIAEQKNIPIKKLAEKIKMSEAGLHAAIRRETLKVKDLEKICEILNINPRIFFKEYENNNEISLVADDVAIYGKPPNRKQAQQNRINMLLAECEKIKLENDYLKQQIKDKEEIIKLLKNNKL